MLLQADYSAAFRMDAVHRGRQINESVTDDVAASMLGELLFAFGVDSVWIRFGLCRDCFFPAVMRM